MARSGLPVAFVAAGKKWSPLRRGGGTRSGTWGLIAVRIGFIALNLRFAKSSIIALNSLFLQLLACNVNGGLEVLESGHDRKIQFLSKKCSDTTDPSFPFEDQREPRLNLEFAQKN